MANGQGWRAVRGLGGVEKVRSHCTISIWPKTNDSCVPVSQPTLNCRPDPKINEGF